VDAAADYEAPPANRSSLVAQVGAFLGGDVEKVQGTFDSAMREIQGASNVSPTPRATLRDVPDLKMDFYQRWELFRPYLTELAGVQEDPWNITDTVVLAAWSAMWEEEDAQFNAVRITLYVSSV
jgi:hypothetical protein